MWLFLLILTALILFSLPLLPMILESMTKTDTDPLVIPLDLTESFADNIDVKDEITITEFTKKTVSIIAKKSIYFVSPIKFKRLNAPVIRFGSQKEEIICYKINDVPGTQDKNNSARKIIKNDLGISEKQLTQGNFVIKGKTKLAPNSYVFGSIKSYSDIALANKAVVNGALMSNKSISLAPDSHVKGPIIAAKKLSIGKNCVIGSPDALTTIVADKIKISSGTIIHGAIIATKLGRFGATPKFIHKNRTC